MTNPALRVADLRAALDLALDAFEAEHGGEIALPHDGYWHLPVDAAFDLSRDPSELTVGSLIDDLDEVRGFIAAGEAFPAGHALGHLVGLLRLLEVLDRPSSREGR